MSERYCLRCGKVVLVPNVNYGINPDVVCKCPPEQPSLASGIPHHQVSQWTKTTQEQSAIDRALWSEIGLAIGRIEANLEKAEKSAQEQAIVGALAIEFRAISTQFKGLNERLGAIETCQEKHRLALESITRILEKITGVAQTKRKRERKGKR